MNKPSHHRRPRSNNNSSGRNQGHKRSSNNSSHGRRGQSNRPKPLNKNNILQQIEKNKNLAKEALQTGDRPLAENYLQHADHYQRVLNDLNPQGQQSSSHKDKPNAVADDAGNKVEGEENVSAAPETPVKVDSPPEDKQKPSEAKPEGEAKSEGESQAKPVRKPRASRKPKETAKADGDKGADTKTADEAPKSEKGEAA